MTIPLSAEARVPLTLGQRARSMFAVAVSTPITHFHPHRIASLLCLVARGSRPATAEEAAQARAAACTVSARCAGLGCLLRSVATFLDCRMRGVTPDWCTGIRTEPFAAHAWIEVDGQPIGEPGSLDSFTTMLAVRPHERSSA